MSVKLIAIADIDLDGSPRTRHRLRDDVIEEYSELYLVKNPKVPYVDLFKPPNSPFYLVADGLHRINGAHKAGCKGIPAMVTEGTWADCMKRAAASNVTHGLRRSPEDKRALLEDVFRNGGHKWPNAQIALMCHVSEELVKSVRKILEAQQTIQPAPVRTNVNGREQTVAGEAKVFNDWTGYPIPETCLGIWRRRQEAQAFVAAIEDLRKRLAVAWNDEDLLFREFDFQTAAADIQSLKRNLGLLIPYAVCPQCQGQTIAVPDCAMCKGRGMVSKFRYTTVVPEELKLLRQKTIEEKGTT